MVSENIPKIVFRFPNVQKYTPLRQHRRVVCSATTLQATYSNTFPALFS